MEQIEEEPPPFWLQSTAALRRADRRRRRQHRASNLFLNTGVLVVLLLAAAVVFLAIVIPSILSLARQVFNPSLVKKSWNSVNLILVLFAIVCGFLGKKDDDQTPVSSPVKREAAKSAESSRSPRQWYEYNQDNSFGNVDTMRLRRNSNSYPDLRQDGRWEMNENNRWRFYDDTDVNTNQFLRSESRISRSRSVGMIDENEIDVKNIEVDTFVNGAKDVAPPSTSPSLSPSPPPQALRKSVYARSRDDEDQYFTKNIQVDTSASNQPKKLKSQTNPPLVNRPLPPPPPPLPTYSYSHQPLSPPSPISTTNYYWPPPSPPPPPPPPRAHPSISSTKKKHENKWNNPIRESRSKYEIQKPPPSEFLRPPSPPSPKNYYWPPPPPPPPPPREHSSALPKKKHENKRNWNDPTRETRSKYVIQKPPAPSDFLQPSSPPSPTNYFWPSPPPPPPPPPPPLPTYSSTLPKKKHDNKRNSPIKRESRSKAQIQTPPPAPPPPPQSQPIVENILEETNNRKRGIVIRTLNRFPRRKRKQAARRSYENLEEFMEPPKTSIHRSKSTPEFPPSSPPPPPPPPPPPHSMFHNIFSKKGKTKKKGHSESTSAPPAPPPPPSRPLPETKRKSPATRRPLPPAKTDSFSSIDENINNGSESPLIPIPPPPPPPPFKMPPWRYVMQGDYVKLESFSNSPRSGYSASEDDESSPSNQKTSMASSSSSVFCPSPDVNTKADDFIARFREKLTLEKNNSIRRQQGTSASPLGSDSSPP